MSFRGQARGQGAGGVGPRDPLCDPGGPRRPKRVGLHEAVGFYEDAIRACRSDEPVDQSELGEAAAQPGRGRVADRANCRRPATPSSRQPRAARELAFPSLLARAAIGTCWGSWESFDADRVVQAVLLEEALAVIGEVADGPLRASEADGLSRPHLFRRRLLRRGRSGWSRRPKTGSGPGAGGQRSPTAPGSLRCCLGQVPDRRHR